MHLKVMLLKLNYNTCIDKRLLHFKEVKTRLKLALLKLKYITCKFKKKLFVSKHAL